MPEPHTPQKSPIVQLASPGTYWWCACGHSKAQPFCDGSHKGTGFAPRKADVSREGKVAWCACKRTGTPPFCDGSHKG